MRYSYLDSSSAASLAAPSAPAPLPSLYRILTPVPPDRRNPLATTAQVPPGARKLLAAVQAPRMAVATYALALELSTGRQIHSVAVRVVEQRIIGAAVWINDKFDNALWLSADLGLRQIHAAAEFLALASGQAYIPPAPRAAPVKGPCPRCHREVRWKLAPTGAQTYAHTREEPRGEGGQLIKVPCA